MRSEGRPEPISSRRSGHVHYTRGYEELSSDNVEHHLSQTAFLRDSSTLNRHTCPVVGSRSHRAHLDRVARMAARRGRVWTALSRAFGTTAFGVAFRRPTAEQLRCA